MQDLTDEQVQSVKKSYLNIVALFLNDEKIESRYFGCLLKWGFQLHINPADLGHANTDISNLRFSHPADRLQKIESIFHLVHMIYLDRVVEDVELEVASRYAERLGFKTSLVAELFKSIATEDSDGYHSETARQQVIDFMKVYEE